MVHASFQLGGLTATDFPLAVAAGPRLSETSPPGGAARADNTAAGTEEAAHTSGMQDLVTQCWWPTNGDFFILFYLSLPTRIELYNGIFFFTTAQDGMGNSVYFRNRDPIY